MYKTSKTHAVIILLLMGLPNSSFPDGHTLPAFNAYITGFNFASNVMKGLVEVTRNEPANASYLAVLVGTIFT